MALTLRKGAAPFRPAKRVLSYAEERFLDEKKTQLEAALNNKELQQGVNFEHRDKPLLEKRLAELKQIKNRFGAVRVEGRERAQSELEIKRIEQAIPRKWGGRIPSYAEYWMRPKEGGIRYLNLVDKIASLNSDPEYTELVKRWKYLRRRMEPEDKRISSTLHLFRHD